MTKIENKTNKQTTDYKCNIIKIVMKTKLKKLMKKKSSICVYKFEPQSPIISLI